MLRAFALARLAEGRTSPNPMVGAVIVRDGRVVGEGYHHRAGAPHAEIEALRDAGDLARGAAMYVTLEPCAHYGRTPPCADAIIEAGVAEVYYAVGDPNPRVNGKAHSQLKAAGIAVTRGLCEDEARELNRPFFKHVLTGRPFVTAKFALSLDGKIATRAGDSRWISNTASRRRAHELRNITDAIIVGAGTVLADDPRLTTRLSSGSLRIGNGAEPADIRHPLRIVADSRGRAPLTAGVFDPALPGKTVLATTDAAPGAHCAELMARGVEVWTLPADMLGRVSLQALLDEIGRRGMLTLLVEGGSELLGSFFDEKLVDRVWAFIAPLIIGGRNAPGPVSGRGVEALAEAIRLHRLQVETIDSGSPDEEPTQARENLWIQANVEYPMASSADKSAQSLSQSDAD
ncbi:MAG: bifunctional diaminohydroxyphosphoribosylaminopyrimidine deaminase/5-amino-6-(5-phosphoribosylamino)uracil reductase RibD [Chloracidobacterium sp.]|nr:bifunctional diaminohydroxyphosphoribosylaminopyrimidine deaminase/5-amino-6-(5-phosphoribosylamino)uracil reductase RibD [Chloracidobacterium sp.]